MARKTRVGMKDISERAGVAMSTVSHVLNGTAPISDEVRARVLEVASELGYLDRRRAKGAIASLSKLMIALREDALPHSDVNLVSWTMMNALTRDCAERGLVTVPFALDDDGSPAGLVAAAKAAQVDGVIVLNDDREEVISALVQAGLPMVLINGEDPTMSVDSVTPGNRFAAEQAVRWLMAKGHENVLHLTWFGRKTVRRRLDGFKDAYADMGLREEKARVLMAESYEPRFGEAAMKDWLAAHPDLDGVTAVFCAADNLAFGAIRALTAAGVKVPEDMSVMGFDGVALGELHSPALTTVNVPFDQFGRDALDLLERRVLARGGERAAHRLELGCTIVERASVAAPRK